MQKDRLTMLAFITGISIIAGCGPTGVQQQSSTGNRENIDKEKGHYFSGWNLKSAEGPSVDLGDIIKGDIAIVSFFASYCTKCKQKLIDHQTLYDKYETDGLSILGVSVDEPETQSSVGTYIRSRGLTFPVVIDTDSRLVNQLNPRRTLPFSVLIDRRGNVLWNHEGYAPGDDKIFEMQTQEALKKTREH